MAAEAAQSAVERMIHPFEKIRIKYDPRRIAIPEADIDRDGVHGFQFSI
jgi:hypothetical protein